VTIGYVTSLYPVYNTLSVTRRVWVCFWIRRVPVVGLEQRADGGRDSRHHRRLRRRRRRRLLCTGHDRRLRPAHLPVSQAPFTSH